MSHRFFVGSDGLSAEQRRQIVTVLRLGAGDTITLVCDGVEQDYRIAAASSEAIEGEVVAQRAAAGEPTLALTLALPVLKGDRSEEVVEAAAQLGVSCFAPFASTRSVVRELSAAKRERWMRIAREAAETARRGRLPRIDPLRGWPELLGALPRPLVVAWEEEHRAALEESLPAAEELALVVGPEGGLTEEEIAAARAAGGVTVTLGRRVLRAETAAIAAVARVMARLEPAT